MNNHKKEQGFFEDLKNLMIDIFVFVFAWIRLSPIFIKTTYQVTLDVKKNRLHGSNKGFSHIEHGITRGNLADRGGAVAVWNLRQDTSSSLDEGSKRCVNCGTYFTPTKGRENTQIHCSISCKDAKNNRLKREKAKNNF